MSDFEIVSPFPPDECAVRLQEATDHRFFSRFGSRPVVGGFHGRQVSLRKRIRYHNVFKTYLIGSLEENGQSTTFRGTAGMHPFLIVFLAIGFGLMLLGCCAIIVLNVLAGLGFPFGVVGVPFVAALVLSVIQFGRWFARDGEQFLLNFVASVLDAEPTSPGAVQDVAARDEIIQAPIGEEGVTRGNTKQDESARL